MADRNAKSANNVPGKYYVDTKCISCGQCVDIAGSFFSEDKNGGMYVYVKVQPNTASEIALCEQALSNCPVEAIGNDGV
ncbi:MAG: ferredoxin [Coxiellaceae bacterium]|jgi:ferredoxin|nr:ferredoxin [Coxiellaceae bacterium]